jgi:hypothetical protein
LRKKKHVGNSFQGEGEEDPDVLSVDGRRMYWRHRNCLAFWLLPELSRDDDKQEDFLGGIVFL